MMFDKVEDCCSFAVAALDGVYGWMSEIIAIAILVFVFNFIAKRLLKRLHIRYERQGKIWRDSFVRAAYDPLSYFVWLFAIIQCLDLIAGRIYHELPISNRHMLIAFGGVLMFSWFLFKWKNYVVQNIIARCKSKEVSFDPGKIEALSKLATVAIIFFTILILMEITHSSLTTIIAFGGVGGLALAFASQEIVANFFGGFMIYLTQPFTIGDWIQIPDNNIEGHVENIGWYMTRIRSLDKRPIYIPNSVFSKLIIITPSRMTHRQIKEILGLRYEDLPRVRVILEELRSFVKNYPNLDQRQPQLVYLSGFGASTVDITINLFTLTTTTDGYTRIKEDLLLKMSELIVSLGGDLAFPTQNISIIGDVNLKNSSP